MFGIEGAKRMESQNIFREQVISIETSKFYAKPYAQKIKNIIWNQFDSTCEVENCSFDTDETVSINIYFLSTDEQYFKLIKIIEERFKIETSKKID